MQGGGAVPAAYGRGAAPSQQEGSQRPRAEIDGYSSDSSGDGLVPPLSATTRVFHRDKVDGRFVRDEPLSESESFVKSTRGGHRLRISNFSSQVRTFAGPKAAFDVAGHQFELMFFHNMRDIVPDGYISLYVRYLGPNDRCYAYWTMRMINVENPANTWEKGWDKGDERNEFGKGRHWGWSKFAKVSRVLDPSSGFLKDDVLTLEISLVVLGTPQTRSLSHLVPLPENTLSRDIRSLLDSEDLADVEFVLDDGATRIKAHRLILAARSKVLRKMLCGSFQERDQRSVEITDISGKAFKSLLDFLYSGELVISEPPPCSGAAPTHSEEPVSTEPERKRRRGSSVATIQETLDESSRAFTTPTSAQPSSAQLGSPDSSPSYSSGTSPMKASKTMVELLVAADKYDLEVLHQSCQICLAKSVTRESVLDLLSLADLCNAKHLTRACLDLVSSSSLTFSTSQVESLSRSVLVQLLQCNKSLVVSSSQDGGKER